MKFAQTEPGALPNPFTFEKHPDCYSGQHCYQRLRPSFMRVRPPTPRHTASWHRLRRACTSLIRATPAARALAKRLMVRPSRWHAGIALGSELRLRRPRATEHGPTPWGDLPLRLDRRRSFSLRRSAQRYLKGGQELIQPRATERTPRVRREATNGLGPASRVCRQLLLAAPPHWFGFHAHPCGFAAGAPQPFVQTEQFGKPGSYGHHGLRSERIPTARR
jgi:hypothetical protein